MRNFTVILINELADYDEVRHVTASSEREIMNSVESGYTFIVAFED